MKAKDVKVGTKVIYYPFTNSKDGAQETVIASEPWECCGNTVCLIESHSGSVDIEHLEKA